MKKSKQQPPESELFYRRATVAAAESGMRATLATEEPVEVYDFGRKQVIKEVLALRGAEWPERLRMVEDHNDSAGSTVGTVKDISRNDNAVEGVPQFASTADGQKYETLYREGHLSDVSIGGQRLQVKYLERGEKFSHLGRDYTGPMRLVMRWKPVHLGLVGTGADPRAKMSLAERAYVDPYGVQRHMEAEQNVETEVATKPVEQEVTREASASGKPTAEKSVKEIVAEEFQRRRDEELAREKAAAEQYALIAKSHGVPDAQRVALDLAREGATMEAALERFVTLRGATRQPVNIYGVESSDDKYRAASHDGFLSRAYQAASVRAPDDFKPAPGWQDFRRTSMKELAKDLLIRSGDFRPGMDDREILRTSMDLSRASDGAAYHSTGSFSNLLLDAFSKVLRATWENTPSTFQDWIRVADPLPDFKNRNVIRLSEVGNLPMVPENTDYKDASLSDLKETYRAYKRGSIVSLTWEAWVNDDLNGFSRIVALQGSAAKRTVNQSVYQILFDNPTLSADSVALFHSSSHANDANSGTGTALSVSALNTAYTAFATKTGLNSDVILGLSPRYLIVPAAYFNTAWQIVASPADPSVGGNTTGSAGVLNLYGPSGARPLQIIMEPLIDGNDSTSWYLAADPMVIDTIELAYLQGEETPVFEQETGFVSDTIKWKVRQSWGVHPIEYRGLYRSKA